MGEVESTAEAPGPTLSTLKDRTASEVDAGLLLIPGIGIHPRRSILFDMVEPLLQRLAEHDQLIGACPTTLGEEDTPGGRYDGLIVTYRASSAISAEHGCRRLLAVEARWEDVFDISPLKTVSTWSALNAGKMMWELSVYIARGWRWISALAVLGLLLAGVALAANRSVALALVLAAALLVMAVVGASDVVLRHQASPISLKKRLLGASVIGTFVLYEIQRGFVLLVTIAGVVLLPVGAVAVRWLSSLPLLDKLGLGMMQSVERSLLTGGIADMEAVASNHVASAAIQARVRVALEELESRVAPGGTVTVLGHSGGAPLAWRLLSEPEIVTRAPERRLRYRIVTVGAALNWALHGFKCLATPLADPLVNADKPEPLRTYWINAFSAWDPAPHGPVNPSDLRGWAAWDAGAFGPNRPVSNLGSPLSAEHSEYFRNQQEFVPALLRAIDPEIVGAETDAGERRQLLSNLRFALVSPLVRFRMIVVAVPLAAIASMIRGRTFICATSAGGAYGRIVDAVAPVVSRALENAHLTWLGDAMCGNRFAQDALVAVLVFLAANALIDVYTNYFWQALGRSAKEMRPARTGPVAIPLVASAMVWLPTILFPPLLFLPFDLGVVYWALVALTIVLAALELVWFNECLLALRDSERFARYNVPMGRRRDEIKHTPAGYSSEAKWPGLRLG